MRKLEENHSSLNLKTNMNEDLNKDNNLFGNQKDFEANEDILDGVENYIVKSLYDK